MDKILPIKKSSIAVLLLSCAFAAQAGAQDNSCSSETLSGQVNINYLQESIKSGEVNFNPTQELSGQLRCGDRWSVNFGYDLNASEAFNFNGGRFESLNLTYNTRNKWAITAGFLGEQRIPEVFFGAPGGRPDIAARHSLYADRVDNNHIVGINVKKSFSMQDGWGFNLDASTFRATSPKQALNRVEDRANSSRLSYTIKGAFTKKTERGQINFGAEEGTIREGNLGNAAETYIGVFGRYKHNLSNSLLWSNSIETLRYNNYFNEKGKTRSLTVAFSDLQWKPRAINGVTLWGQLGLNKDSVKHDGTFLEVGGRYDLIKTARRELSLIGAIDLERDLVTKKSFWGSQIGLRAKLRF